MKRTFLYLVVVFCLAFPFLKAQAQDMSHEEEVVRNTYARFSLMCSLPPLTRAGMEQLGGAKIDPRVVDAESAKATPVYELSDFRTGAIADIANDTWNTFVTVPRPKTEILDGSGLTESYSDNGNNTEWYMAKVQWTPAHNGNSKIEKLILAQPVFEIIKLGIPQWQYATTPITYTRYAAFTVNVRLQGKSSGPHRAIFFFGNDIKGREYVAENDLISGGELGYALYPNNDPSGLLLGKIREAPIVANWLRNNVMPASDCPASTQHAWCCSHGRCGISPVDFNKDLAIPLPGPKN